MELGQSSNSSGKSQISRPPLYVIFQLTHCLHRLFDVLLTDDPVNWPWSAYLNLPLIPISLIISRFQSTNSPTIVPLLLAWPPSFPVGDNSRKRMVEYWSKPENVARLGSGGFLLLSRYWPPPPIFFGLIGLPIIRALYRRCYAHAYSKVLGIELPAPRLVERAGLRFDEGPFVIRIRANLNGDAGADEQDAVDAAQPQPQGQGQQNQAAGAGAGAGEEQQDPNVAAVEAAEQLIEINASSLGRRVGGALIIPAIANTMGSLLLSISKHSSVLRAVLGIRQRVSGGGNSILYPYPPWARLPFALDTKWSDLSLLQQSKFGVRLIMNAFLGGTKTWEELDPVW